MKITKHISTQSLPRLIIINGQLDDMKYVDIGLSLSKIIESSLNSKHLALEANDAIDTIIKDNVLHNKDIGNYIALCNIGILFEPALHLDLHNKFRTLSKSLTLIINDNECSASLPSDIVISKEILLKFNSDDLMFFDVETSNRLQ